jgi:hypothetical protein
MVSATVSATVETTIESQLSMVGIEGVFRTGRAARVRPQITLAR